MVKAYWDGADRQRAVSMWSIGSFGGAGLAASLGGLIATTMGWRWIFVFSIVVSLAASLLVWGTPESRVGADAGHRRFDIAGLGIFLVMLLALMMLLTFGGKTFGWLSGTGLALSALALVGLAVFIAVERGRQGAFIDFGLVSNMNFTGTVTANFMMYSTLGLLIVSQQLLVSGGGMKPLAAGALTLGYPLMVVLFIRAGERLPCRMGRASR